MGSEEIGRKAGRTVLLEWLLGSMNQHILK